MTNHSPEEFWNWGYVADACTTRSEPTPTPARDLSLAGFWNTPEPSQKNGGLAGREGEKHPELRIRMTFLTAGGTDKVFLGGVNATKVPGMPRFSSSDVDIFCTATDTSSIRRDSLFGRHRHPAGIWYTVVVPSRGSE